MAIVTAFNHQFQMNSELFRVLLFLCLSVWEHGHLSFTTMAYKTYTNEEMENCLAKIMQPFQRATRPDTRQSSRGWLGRSSSAKTARNSKL